MLNPVLNQIIENQVANLSGYSFQEFCERMLRVKYKDFQTIRPSGSHGDGNSDGYCTQDRKFFQCYGTKGVSAKKVEAKIRRDFHGCVGKNYGVKEFIFLSNQILSFDAKQVLEELNLLGQVTLGYWGPPEISMCIQQFTPDEIDFVLDYPLNQAMTDFRKRPIFYSEEEGSVNEIPFIKAMKRSIIAVSALIGTALILIATVKYGIVSFLIGTKGNFGSIVFTLLITAPLAIVLWHLKYIKLLSLPVLSKDKYFQGRFLSRPTKELGLEYVLSAKCIYPNCTDGMVRIYPAPEKEKQKYNRSLIGRCSRDEKEHTYTFDANRTGLVKEFEHGPVEPSTKSLIAF